MESTLGRPAQSLYGLYESLPVICIMSLFYLTNIVLHLLPLFKHAAGHSAAVAYTAKQPTGSDKRYWPVILNLPCTYVTKFFGTVIMR